jgi:hypothetical protein
MEWGTKATELMWELKQLFDPDFVLNPGVILNRCVVRNAPIVFFLVVVVVVGGVAQGF